MSEFSRETLLNIIETDHVQCGEASALARMALAAMDSEPAIADCDPEVYEKGVSVCLVAIPKETAEIICQNITAATGCKVDWHYFGGRVHIKALREPSQSAPVVPEKCPAEIRDLIASHSDALFNDDDAQEIWNACRAAMLAAAPQSPGSEPATVPGKWIPVSERMPIEFEAVIAFDGDQVYGEAMYSSDDGFTIDGYDPCDRVQLQNVTHWMPLPSAPQEVKGE